MSRAKLPTFCGTCGAEGADPCPECAADETRGEFVAICERLIVGDGDQAAQVARARELRESGRWSAHTVKALLGSANRRAAEPLRQRDLALAGHGHRQPGQPTRKRRSAAR